MNEVYLRRCLKLIPDPGRVEGKDASSTLADIATVQKNLESLGFTLSERLAETLSAYPRAALAELYKKLSKQLRKMTGAHRANELIRVFFPKGNVAKAFARPEPLPLLPAGIAARAAQICRAALLRLFAEKGELGKCWVDPALEDYRVPLANRSASKTLRTLARGTRLALPDANTLRFFIWWRNGLGRTDLDLSAAFYDSRFRFIDTVSYYNLTSCSACTRSPAVNVSAIATRLRRLSASMTAPSPPLTWNGSRPSSCRVQDLKPGRAGWDYKYRLNYDRHQDNENPAHFMFYENWESREFWQAHMDMQHLKDHMAATDGAVENFTLNEMTHIV